MVEKKADAKRHWRRRPEVVIKGNSIRRDSSSNRRSMSVVVLAGGDNSKLSAASMSIKRHTRARDQLHRRPRRQGDWDHVASAVRRSLIARATIAHPPLGMAHDMQVLVYRAAARHCRRRRAQGRQVFADLLALEVRGTPPRLTAAWHLPLSGDTQEGPWLDRHGPLTVSLRFGCAAALPWLVWGS